LEEFKIPSTFEEIIITLIFILPGFLAIFLASKLAHFEKPRSIFEHTLWSLISSIAIYVAVIFAKGITNYESLSNIIFQPETISIIILIALFEGVALACLHRLNPLKYLRQIVQWRTKVKYSPTPHVWDEELATRAKNSPTWVLVYTKKGLEYKGVVVTWTVGETPKELLITRPKLILRDDDKEILDQIEMGDAILFLEDDIARIVFL